MGMFSKSQENVSEKIYEDQVKNLLKEKDGNVHILMLNSFSKLANQAFGVDDKYVTQIDYILSRMQEDGYEILDIKFNSIQDQGVFKNMEGFHTLITYK